MYTLVSVNSQHKSRIKHQCGNDLLRVFTHQKGPSAMCAMHTTVARGFKISAACNRGMHQIGWGGEQWLLGPQSEGLSSSGAQSVASYSV